MNRSNRVSEVYKVSFKNAVRTQISEECEYRQLPIVFYSRGRDGAAVDGEMCQIYM